MTIVSSVIAKNIAKDGSGRNWIREDHTDHLGVVHESWYRMQTPAFDINAALVAGAVRVADELAQAEIVENIAAIKSDGSQAIPVFQHSTPWQNQDALRLAYKTASRLEAVMVGDFLSTLTDAQLRSVFSMTAAQVTQLRTDKLTPAANFAATLRAAAGA